MYYPAGAYYIHLFDVKFLQIYFFLFSLFIAFLLHTILSLFLSFYFIVFFYSLLYIFSQFFLLSPITIILFDLLHLFHQYKYLYVRELIIKAACMDEMQCYQLSAMPTVIMC